MQSSKPAKRGWVLLFAVIAAFYLYGLGKLPLLGPDEPRYAEVAREMFSRRDLITPTLGGWPWFEKPPLLYWLMMAGYRLFGVSEYAARLGPAICGLLTSLFVYLAAKNVEEVNTAFASADTTARDRDDQNREGLARWSALAFLSSGGAIAFSRAATPDIVVAMTLTGALACFFIWHLRSDQDPGVGNVKIGALLLGFYLFVGLSLLAKGLIGVVIPFGVVAVYFLMRREWPQQTFLKSLFWGVPLALAVCSVWYAPMIARHGWRFIDEFIIQQHFARFATNKYHHPEPFYFYLPVLAFLALPWTIFLIAGFVNSRRWKWRGKAPLDRLRVFGLAWIVMPIVFFSFSESKLPGYLLPVMPAAALLIGERLISSSRTERDDKLIRLTGILLILVAVAGGWYTVHHFSLQFSWVSTGVLMLSGAGAFALFVPRFRRGLLLLIPLTTLIALAITINSISTVAMRRNSVRDLMQTAAARGYASTPVILMLTRERSVQFYAAGRLDCKPDGEPFSFDGAKEVADAAAHRGGVALVLVPTEWEKELTDYSAIEAEEIGNNGVLTLFAIRVR